MLNFLLQTDHSKNVFYYIDFTKFILNNLKDLTLVELNIIIYNVDKINKYRTGIFLKIFFFY